MHEADAIADAALRRSFLTQIPENREIAALSAGATTNLPAPDLCTSELIKKA